MNPVLTIIVALCAIAGIAELVLFFFTILDIFECSFKQKTVFFIILIIILSTLLIYCRGGLKGEKQTKAQVLSTEEQAQNNRSTGNKSDRSTNRSTSNPTRYYFQDADYILNKSTKKFHLPSCGSVQQMDRENIIVFRGTRNEVIDMGYSP